MISSLESSNQSSLIGGLLGTSGVTNLSSSQLTTEEAAATLASRRFLENYIIKYDLLQILFPDSWDNDKEDWISDIDEIPTIFDGYSILSDSLKISYDKSLMTAELILHDKNNVATVLNGLIFEVNTYLRNKAILESGENISFLQKEISKTQLADSKDMLYRLVEQQTQSIMLANTRKDFAFGVIDPAIEPIHPAGPNRKLIVIIATLLGFLLSTLTAFLIHSLNINKSL